MPVETVRVDWMRNQLFLLRDRFDFPLVMTQPMGANGSDLLPLSVIGCAVWDILDILRKQRQPVTGLDASAESIREDEPPWRFKSIHIRYRITGRGLDEKQVRRAIELSETKYCSTLATLRAVVEITSEFEIIAEEGEKRWNE